MNPARLLRQSRRRREERGQDARGGVEARELDPFVGGVGLADGAGAENDGFAGTRREHRGP